MTGPGGKLLKKFRPKGQRAISDGVAYEVTSILEREHARGHRHAPA